MRLTLREGKSLCFGLFWDTLVVVAALDYLDVGSDL